MGLDLLGCAYTLEDGYARTVIQVWWNSGSTYLSGIDGSRCYRFRLHQIPFAWRKFQGKVYSRKSWNKLKYQEYSGTFITQYSKLHLNID